MKLASWTLSQPNLSQNNQSRPYQIVLKLENSLTQFPNHMICSISKQSFSKLLGERMLMTGVLSSVFTPREETNSNVLPKAKVIILSESVIGLQSFPMTWIFTPKGLPAPTHGRKMNSDTNLQAQTVNSTYKSHLEEWLKSKHSPLSKKIHRILISYLTSKIFLHKRQNNFYALVNAS